MRVRGRRVAALAIALLVGGCTSSTWDTSEIDDTTPTTIRTYPRTDAGLTDSLTDYLSNVGTDLGEWAPPKDEARCAATRIVRRLTVEHLLEIGYDPQEPSLALEYPADDRTAVINILSGCVDVSAAILETFSSYQKLPLAQSNCMAEGFARLELSRDVIVALVDGKEPDAFANSDRYASGLASLAVECMEEDDLLPNGLLPKLPAPKNAPASTTTSTTVPTSDDDLLEGIEPGSPLDTTTTTSG